MLVIGPRVDASIDPYKCLHYPNISQEKHFLADYKY